MIKRFFPYFVVLCFGLFLVPQFYNKKNETIKENNQVESLVRIIETQEKIGLDSREKKEELKTVLEKRKEKLLLEAETNPGAFKQNILPKEVLDNIPTEQRGLVEQEVKKEGKFISAIADLKSGGEERLYGLKSERNYEIHFVNEPKKKLITAQKAVAEGWVLGTELVLESSESPNLVITEPLTPLNEFGQQNTLVIMHKFTDNNPANVIDSYDSHTITGATVLNEFINNSDSTDKYYRENSFYTASPSTGVYFTGATAGWYTIGYNSSAGCDLEQNEDWTDLADSAAIGGGHNLGNYNRKAYLFPDVPSCAWAGLAYVGGDTSWYNGYDNSQLWSHEIGHNLGNGHASSLDCGNVTVDSYANCTVSEYGSNYDTMGNWNQYHYNATHKANDGWISASRVTTATTNGTYTIYPLETHTANPQTLRIQKPNTDEYYYFEYRQPVGFDSTLPVGHTRGVTANIWNENFWDNSYLIDFTPANGFSDAALSDGQTFTDSANGFSVTQVSHNVSSVTLSVAFASHVITATDGVFGSISPSGSVVVVDGASQTFNMIPDSGYRVLDVVVDGVSQGRVNSYTFTNVTANHTIHVTFDYQPVLNRFLMSGHTGTKTAGMSFNVTVTAQDQYWNNINEFSGPLVITSSDTQAILPNDDGVGWVNGQKTFSIVLKTAPWKNITFTYGSISASSSVSVNPASLEHLNITPNTPQVITSPDGNITFSAQGQDTYNNNISNLTYSWTNTNYSNSGLIGYCKTPGVYQVSATSGGINSPSVQVTVNPGPLTSLTISAPQTTITAGNTTQFNAVAKDACSNVIATPVLSWTGTDSDGLFVNTTAGNNYPVRATFGGIQSNLVYVNVAAGALDHIDISPSTSQTVVAGNYIDFTAAGRDYFGNYVSTALTWIGATQSTPARFFSGPAGSYIVKATSGAFESPTVTVTVVPSALSHIHITPNNDQTIDPGEMVSFSAQGQDQYHNNISGLTYNWAGANSSGVFTTTVAGRHTITAYSGGVSQSVFVTVSPGPLHHIDITPSGTIILQTSQPLVFTATGEDQYNNEIPNLNYVWYGVSDAFGNTGTLTIYDAENLEVYAKVGEMESPRVTVNGLKASFTPTKIYHTSGWNASDSKHVVTGDFNGDGKQDLAAMYDYGYLKMGIWVFTGKGDGTYNSPTRWFYTTGWNVNDTKQLLASDLNSDGTSELTAVYNYGNLQMGMWTFSPNNNSFTPAKIYHTSGWNANDSKHVVTGDFNGDGKQDLAAMYDYGYLKMGIWVFTGKGDGTYNSPTRWFYSPSWNVGNTKHLVASDLNGDGTSELSATYNYGNLIMGVWTFTSNGSSFAPAKVVDVFGWNDFDSKYLVAGDFDGDGKQDLAAMYDYGYLKMGLWVFTGRGNGIYNYPTRWFYTTGWNVADTKQLVASDLNGDGISELTAVYNYGNLQMGMWRFR